MSLRVAGADEPTVAVSDYTVGLQAVPNFTPRPVGLDRSALHSSELVVVGAVHERLPR